MVIGPEIRITQKLFFFLMVIYLLAALSLSLSIQDLPSSLQHVWSSSLTRDRTQAPCIGSVEF